MMANTGKIWLENLRRRWILLTALQVVVYALCIALIVAALMHYFYNHALTGFLIAFIVSVIILSWVKEFWRLSLQQVSSFVDRKFPELEDSSSLLIADPASLSALQRLQTAKINSIILQQRLPSEPIYQLRNPLLLLVLCTIFFLLFLQFVQHEQRTENTSSTNTHTSMVVKEVVPVEIAGYSVTIVPPAYTGKKSRNQEQFTLLAESGSKVSWNLKTSEPVDDVNFIWNDKEIIKLKRTGEKGTSWTFNKVLNKPGFYQVVLDGKKSDFYQVEIIPDQPVAIKIQKPVQHSTIDFGQPHQVDLQVLMTDDYGISNAVIHATTASGKGEAVSFKEQQISFNTIIRNQRRLNLNQRISLAKLGMKPGDELYFYINATDNHGQQSRSDMYFVSIQDTAALMSMAGIDNGVNLVPEYFRSQRQIIIDTEKLLRERNSISESTFKQRSNELGIDQKMLRLRYGKFLGEEEETTIGGKGEDHEEHSADDGHGHEAHGAESPAFGDVQALMDQYAHKHDQAEDATFFEPELKAQLKATLNEMWSAELQLRTYDPQKALPFEYKALRLLKDLQQKSRAYVAKTVVKTTPLKPEKRLSGELKDIQETAAVTEYNGTADKVSDLSASLSFLEARKAGAKGKSSELKVLRTAEQALITAAASAPNRYLPALSALKKVIASWTNQSNVSNEIALAEKGINSLIGTAQAKPYKAAGSSNDLSEAYFNQLNRTKR